MGRPLQEKRCLNCGRRALQIYREDENKEYYKCPYCDWHSARSKNVY